MKTSPATCTRPRTEAPDVWALVGRAAQKGYAALFAHALDRAPPLSIFGGDEKFAILERDGMRTSDVASMTGWDEVRGVIVAGILVEVIDDERTGCCSGAALPPSYLATAPVTGMPAGTDLREEDGAMLFYESVLGGERVPRTVQVSVTAHSHSVVEGVGNANRLV